MKYLVLLVFSLFFIKNTVNAQTSYGTLEGKMIDKETGEGLIAASVLVYKTGEKTPINGASTDINGNFSMDSIPVGIYDVEFSYVCYNKKTIKNVIISSNLKTLKYSLREQKGDCAQEEVVVVTVNIPLINPDDFGMGRVYTSGGIQNSPLKW